VAHHYRRKSPARTAEKNSRLHMPVHNTALKNAHASFKKSFEKKSSHPRFSFGVHALNAEKLSEPRPTDQSTARRDVPENTSALKKQKLAASKGATEGS
jgi:hypothetical protein